MCESSELPESAGRLIALPESSLKQRCITVRELVIAVNSSKPRLSNDLQMPLIRRHSTIM
nr:MAG TPA: hypothetical protein [Caudoviricetes sp.]